MDYAQFMARVQEFSGLSKEESLNVTEVVLETLGERLQKKHREHLSVQLPGRLRECVLRRSKTEIFPLEGFYERISARAKLHLHDAIKQTRAVFRALQSAVPEGELRDIFAELTPEYGELIGRTPERISPSTVDAHELYSKR